MVSRFGIRSFALLVLVTLAARPALAQNLVQNPGFETGNLTSWTLAPGGSFDFVCLNGSFIISAPCAVNSGSYAMTFGLAGGVDILSQSLATVAGSTYNLSFSLANDMTNGSSGTRTFDAFWGGVNVFSLVNPGTLPYSQHVFLNLTANTNSTLLEFRARHDPSQWFLDDVSATVTPEPATMSLLASGLAGMAGAGLRRRRKKA